MNIDDSIIVSYLKGEDLEDLKGHWLFHQIEKGSYLFEEPSNNHKDSVSRVYNQMMDSLQYFQPMNKKFFGAIFPTYKELLDELNIILIVGCPSPYDAMFLTYKNKAYIVFDLIRLGEYLLEGYEIKDIVNQMITHEFAHQCINQNYKEPIGESYTQKLAYIVFNEGIAHLLAYRQNIEQIDWQDEVYIKHYESAISQLQEALLEKEEEEQTNYLIKADTGTYWSKFGAIAGKIYFANNMEKLTSLYHAGYERVLGNIVVE